MPKTTSGGSSNAWEPDEAPVEQEAAPQETVAPEPEPPAPVVQGEAPGAYGSMTHAELRDEAKVRGLAASGSKADIAARLADHDRASVDADYVAEDGTEPEAGE